MSISSVVGAELTKQKTVMITGANSGIGKAAAVQLASQGHHIFLAWRSPHRGEEALRDVEAQANSEAVELVIIDMSSQSSIHSMNADFLSDHARLDVLIHNAAIFDITQKEPHYTDEGIESVWATNHLGPVLLTDSLWPALANSSQGRVIIIASKGLMAKPFLKGEILTRHCLNILKRRLWSSRDMTLDFAASGLQSRP